VILLASLTKTRQHCDADEMLQKATTYIYIDIFEEVGQKVVIYDIMTVGFCPSSIDYIGKSSIGVLARITTTYPLYTRS